MNRKFKRYKTVAFAIALITGTIAMNGCGSKEKDTTNSQNESKQQTVKKEEKLK